MWCIWLTMKQIMMSNYLHCKHFKHLIEISEGFLDVEIPGEKDTNLEHPDRLYESVFSVWAMQFCRHKRLPKGWNNHGGAT